MCHPKPTITWTKSVKNVALSYPQNAHPDYLIPLWPLPWHHPGQCCPVEVRNGQARLQHCFRRKWGGGGVLICNCQCLLYLETRHGNVHFCQNNIVVKDCILKLWFSFNSCVTWSVSASILIQIRDLTSTTSMKRQKRCMLSISANLCCRFDWSWMQHGHWWPFLKINLNCTKVVVAKLCSIPGGYSRVKVTGMIKRAQKWKPKKLPRASRPTKPASSVGLPMA